MENQTDEPANAKSAAPPGAAFPGSEPGDPSARIARLIETGQTDAAKRALLRLGHARAYADELLPFGAMLALKQGDARAGLAAAWRAAERFPGNRAIEALKTHALARCGAKLVERPAPAPAPSAISRVPEALPPVPRRRPRAIVPEDIVDVIVPVHRGRRETLECLQSLLESPVVQRYRIVAIDDASPEPKLSDALRKLAQAGHIDLLVNRANLGFAGSVNLALARHPGRDAVLLNADTLVAPGWLDRLAAIAKATPRAGTVTPLTNDGQHVSVPHANRSNPCPDRERLAVLDRAAAQVNRGCAVDLPTGAGFCLYITARCRAETGPFDATAFGRGYGEETDFCLRAAARGWRNLCATDVFVAHRGGCSFGSEKAALVARNMALVAARHPHYRAKMEHFLRDDPLGPARARLAAAASIPTPGRPPMPERYAPPASADPNRIAVFGGAETAAGQSLLLARTRKANAQSSLEHFFLFHRPLHEAALVRTGRVTALGEVAPEDRAPLARALNCGGVLNLGAIASEQSAVA